MRASPHLQPWPTTVHYVKKQRMEGGGGVSLVDPPTPIMEMKKWELGELTLSATALVWLAWYRPENLQGERLLFIWKEGRSMDKINIQISFQLKHSILCRSMNYPQPIKIHLNSSANILGDPKECGCSVCLLQLIVSRLCPWRCH